MTINRGIFEFAEADALTEVWVLGISRVISSINEVVPFRLRIAGELVLLDFYWDILRRQ